MIENILNYFSKMFVFFLYFENTLKTINIPAKINSENLKNFIQFLFLACFDPAGKRKD